MIHIVKPQLAITMQLKTYVLLFRHAGNGKRSCSEGGRINSTRINSVRINSVRINSVRINSVRINGGRINGRRINGGRINGRRINTSSGRMVGNSVAGNCSRNNLTTVLTKVVATEVTVSVKLAMDGTTFVVLDYTMTIIRTLKMLKYVYHTRRMMLGLGVYLRLMAAG